MSPFRKRKERRRILDVHFRPLHQPKKIVYGLRHIVSGLWGSEEILDLRQNIWRQPEFRMIAAFFMIVILLFSFQKIFTRAEVVDFYPSNCLGTWENPQSAQGEPETFHVDPTVKILSVSNSAVYAGGESQIFCGGFIPVEYEASGTIQQVGITLVLQVGDIKEIAPAAIEVQTVTSTPPLEVQSAPSSTEPIEALEPPPPPSPEMPTSTIEPTQPENHSTTTSNSSWYRLKINLFALAFAQEENPPAQTPPEPPPPAPEQTSPPSEPSPPTPEPILSPPQNTSTETLPPAPELIELIESDDSSDVRPEDSVPRESERPATSTIIAPPIFAPLLPIETPAETSSVTESAPPALTTSSEPVLVPLPSPDEHFLKVSYSIDGELWVEAGKINPVNWPNFTFTLPITSWDELKKLQVRLEGIATNLPEPLPPVYLDGMLLEVRYEVSPSPGAVATSTPSTAVSQPQKLVTFDPRSTHTCKVEPFSQTLTRGAALSYQVNLKPSRPLAGFELVTGDLPSGITAVFDQSKGWAGAEQTLTVEAAGTAQVGSFNLVVVYREQNEESELLPNFCQLNLIIE